MAGMRQFSLFLGILMTLGGVLFTLQGLGVAQGSAMSNTTTWAVLGPIIALAGVGLVYVNRSR